MLIKEKLRQGSIYPQITQAPTDYFDFLNFFRGGHTIDDNLTAPAIATTLQANLLRAAISSGHLTKTKNMAIPDEFLADIVLTEEGAKRILTPPDKQPMADIVLTGEGEKRPMESHKSDWERVSETKLGGGGQSDVYLVRTPERTKQRARSLATINRFTPVQRVGVWARTRIKNSSVGSNLGWKMALAFFKYEESVRKRRKSM